MFSVEGKIPVLTLGLIIYMKLCNVNEIVDKLLKAGICEPLPEVAVSADYGEKW